MNLFVGEEHNQKNTMEAAGLLVQFCKRVGATRLQVTLSALAPARWIAFASLCPTSK